jgi:hypothetical protein
MNALDLIKIFDKKTFFIFIYFVPFTNGFLRIFERLPKNLPFLKKKEK